jgi:hypothetical protein
VRRVAALLLLALSLAACDPSAYLAIRNDSDAEALVRLTEQFDSSGAFVQVFRVPAHTSGVASPPEIGELKGSIEILSADCASVGSIPAQGGSIATIGADGSFSIRYSTNDDQPIEGGLQPLKLCGGQVDSE